MPILHRDFETRSTLDLNKVGASRYAAHSDTDVLCCAYAVDDGPVSLWVPGDPIPPEWVKAARDPAWLVAAHNDNFERQIEAHIMAPRYGWPVIPIERHRCTMAAAEALALPRALDKAAAALTLAHQKDAAGRDNMMRMVKPRKRKKGEPAGTYWHDDPARLDRLYAYCKQDVETERALHARIGFIPAAEQAVWQLDQKINDRGVFIDGELALGAVKIDEVAHGAINTELSEITGGAVKTINQDDKLRAWLAACGCPVDNIQKETISHALTRKGILGDARRVLELRRDGAHAAVNKYAAMLDRRSAGGRLRGGFHYHGGSTGRWSSLGVQIQNLKKAPRGGIAAETLDAIKSGNPQSLATVGDVVRGAFCAAPGQRFIDADFSGIEARVTAWLAGEMREITQWAKFDETREAMDEPYLITGATAGQPRDKGKVMTLAFGFAGGKGAYRALAGDDHQPMPMLIATKSCGEMRTQGRANFGMTSNAPR